MAKTQQAQPASPTKGGPAAATTGPTVTALANNSATATTKGTLYSTHGVLFTGTGATVVTGEKLAAQWPNLQGTAWFAVQHNSTGAVLFTRHSKGLKAWAYAPQNFGGVAQTAVPAGYKA